jgi:hypothetical protein
MPSTTPTYTYPFDPTGTKSTNLIQGERLPISPPSWSDFYFIIPAATPYFRTSLQVVHHPSGKILAEGVDFNCTHRFHDASLACGMPIYGSITFLDKTLTGVIELKYQTIGGAWTVDSAKILQILSDTLRNPRITTWEEVTDLPFEFPVIDHQWDLVDLVGASEVVESLEGIKDAILASGNAGLADHLVDYNNPHRVTKDQVGLGNVPNYTVADVPTATAGTDNASFMTPLRTAQAIGVQAVTPLNTHVSNFLNPHQVSKDQVGLPLVQNYGIALQADAQAATSNTLYMTPLRVGQAITTLALGPLGVHTARTDNPHGTTATQVGLGNVQNYGIASTADAQAGTRNDVYMTPSATRQAILSQSGSDLTNHINNTNNPHSTTATQVGLGLVQNFGLATQAQAEAGTSNAVYMTPQSTLQAINLQVKTPLTTHVNNTSNPHLVTQEQVGLGNVANYPVASSAQAASGSSDAAYMTPLKVAQAIAALAGSGAAEGLAAHIADQNNPHATTALQVGAYTTTQADAAIAAAGLTKLDKTGQAADSLLLRGLTPAQIVGGVQTRYYIDAVNTINSQDGDGNPIVINNGITWSWLAGYTPPTTPDPDHPVKDIVFYVVGGDPRYAIRDSVYKIHMSMNDYTTLKVTCLEGDPTAVTFGYSVDATTHQMKLWSKNAVHRKAMTLSVQSDPGGGFGDGAQVVDAEPAGILYTSTLDDRPSLQGAAAGQIYFGRSAAQFGPDEAGSLVEFINVAESTDDETACQDIAGNIKDDYRMFERTSAFGSVNRDAFWGDVLGYAWDDTNGVLVGSSTPSTTRAALISNRVGMKQYQFEVELGATGTEAMAVGVCAARARRSGKDFGLYVLRTPGGLALQSTAGTLPGGDIYGLMTVGVNLLEDDAVSVAKINTGLNWGDGVLDSSRASAGAYVPSGHGWDTAGPVRVRVTRTYDSILIETTQHGETDYAAGTSVTIDLTSKPELAIFRGYTTWGVCSYAQTSPTFDVLQRPDFYVPYVAVHVSDAGVDTSSLNRWTGGNWDSRQMTITDQNSQPGRLYHSAYNGKLYYVLADGTLRSLPIEAFSSSDHTVLTT